MVRVGPFSLPGRFGVHEREKAGFSACVSMDSERPWSLILGELSETLIKFGRNSFPLETVNRHRK